MKIPPIIYFISTTIDTVLTTFILPNRKRFHYHIFARNVIYLVVFPKFMDISRILLENIPNIFGQHGITSTYLWFFL